MTIGRRVVNVAQKARGKEPIKYELEVIPYTACRYLAGAWRNGAAWLDPHACIHAVLPKYMLPAQYLCSNRCCMCNSFVNACTIPGEIPAEYERLLFCWERGSKLFVTDAEEVRNNRSVVWRQFLKQVGRASCNAQLYVCHMLLQGFLSHACVQTATFYKGPNGFEPKEFAFKLQSAKASSKGSEERKTVAKVHVDLSQYCTGQVNPQPVEKTFTLK